MTPQDLRILCTALGFTAVVMQGGKLPKSEGALRATSFANLIEEFCCISLPEIFSTTETSKGISAEKRDTRQLMVSAIVKIYKQSGHCQPHDLRHEGFTPDEIARYWPMAYALAKVELNILDS